MTTKNSLPSCSYYEQQLHTLTRKYGLLILCQENAHLILRRISVDRLWQYGSELLDPENRTVFLEGVYIEHLYQIFLFDCRLRSITRDALEMVELQMKSGISALLTEKYGPFGYLNSNNFAAPSANQTVSRHSSIIHRCSQDIVHHYDKSHRTHSSFIQHVPFSIAVEYLSFGTLNELYKIMHKQDRKDLADRFGYKSEYIGSWLSALAALRNMCCHHTTLFNRPLKKAPKLLKEDKTASARYPGKLFSAFLIMKRLLETANQPFWVDICQRLDEAFAQNESLIHPDCAGFPEDWMGYLSADPFL